MSDIRNTVHTNKSGESHLDMLKGGEQDGL